MNRSEWDEIFNNDFELIHKMVEKIKTKLPLLPDNKGYHFLIPIKDMLLEAYFSLVEFEENGIDPFCNVSDLEDGQDN